MRSFIIFRPLRLSMNVCECKEYFERESHLRLHGKRMFPVNIDEHLPIEDFDNKWRSNLIISADSNRDDQEYYSEGMCHAFAIGMIEANPTFRLKVLLSKHDTYITGDGEEVPSIIHVYAVDASCGIAYDIIGARKVSDIVEECDNRYGEDVYPAWMETPGELNEMISRTTEDGDYVDMPLSEISKEDIDIAKELSIKLFPGLQGVSKKYDAASIEM